jgi:hypothetical protein
MQWRMTMHLPTLTRMQILIPTPMILMLPCPLNPTIPMQGQQTTTCGA